MNELEYPGSIFLSHEGWMQIQTEPLEPDSYQEPGMLVGIIQADAAGFTRVKLWFFFLLAGGKSTVFT